MNWAEWDMFIDVVLQVRRHGGMATAWRRACSSSEGAVNRTVTVAHSTAGLLAFACGLGEIVQRCTAAALRGRNIV
jgi:hypothetical protein